MTPEIYVIIDDRELPQADVGRLLGQAAFGDLLRRRRRYVDELKLAAVTADGVVSLRTDDDLAPLRRRLETGKPNRLWLRWPTVIAPKDMSDLERLIGRLRFTLDPVLLTLPVEDEAATVLFSEAMLDLIDAETTQARRRRLLDVTQNAMHVPLPSGCLDLRKAEDLRQFLTGATEPRGFNALSAEEGVLVKSSNDIAKMQAEYDYFALAPAEMQRFLLPTFDFQSDGTRASYRMEHLHVPDAALQFVLGALGTGDFDRLLDQFFAFVAARPHHCIGVSEVKKAGKTQIVDKLSDRVDNFLATDDGQKIDALLQAGGIAYGLIGLRDRANALIEAALTDFKGESLAFSHGDPCLSNILYDPRLMLIRLVDPKGASTVDAALMHPLYDIAKFSHSILGGYDFVNNGLASVEVADSLELSLVFHHGGPPEWVQDRFRDRLKAHGWSVSSVRAVEASLFLSMLPLHLDHPQKCLAFALIARSILDELEAAL